jgi:4-amino-4-deoxy-L-arabinose transferase-like glycosyltransferase
MGHGRMGHGGISRDGVGWARVSRPLLILILATTLVRLAFGAAIGLGVDESYMVASGRVLSFGYFDHPPAAWWLSWGAAHLFGSEAPIVVRLPFILLFALTTWLMARLGEAVVDRRAGFWAALTLNLSPVFGITSGGWVLPDGPLDCALTGAALCLVHALEDRDGWRWWAGAGICAGLALFSKYSAILTIVGAALFLIADPLHRAWLRRWQPWLAALLALLIFSPVVIWNAQHDWASIAFQGARAGGLRFRPLLPFSTLAGEALFVLPWFWVPMVWLGLRALRSGWRDRLLAFLAAPPIVLFAAVSAWSSRRVLYHWAAPGYLMLFPLFGRWVAASWDRRAVRAMIVGTAALCLTAVVVIGGDIRLDWLGPVMPAKDPTAEGMDWTALRGTLAARGLLKPGTVVGVPNWRDAGKIAYGLGPDVPVICLNQDSRQFGFAMPATRWKGATILLLSVGRTPGSMDALFSRVEPLPSVAITLRGRTVKTIAVARGFGLRPEGL